MNMPNSMTYTDYAVFALIFGGCAAVPIYTRFCGTREKTKADYVFATGKVSCLAMAFSIARGAIGIKAFLGYPSELYYRGCGMWETFYGVVIGNILVCLVFVPIYFAVNITSIYEYLEMRFHSRLVRCLASFTAILRGLQKLGVTVFTPCVALKLISGLSYTYSIALVTSISMAFNFMAGLKSSVHIDVIQGVVITICSFAIIVQGIFSVKGVSPIVNIPLEQGRLNFFNFDMDPTARITTVSATLGQLFIQMSLLGCQQTYVQRYRSMANKKEANIVLLGTVLLGFPLLSLTWIIGMVIFAEYSTCDPFSLGLISKMDEIVPFYIEDKFGFLPGFMGLFTACLFTSAISFTVSNLNSLATCTWEDFFQPLAPMKDFNDQKQLLAIKILGTLYGVVTMFIAYGAGSFSGVIDFSVMMASSTAGPLLGVFILAALFPCVNWKGAAFGMILGHVLTIWIAIGSLTLDKPSDAILPLSTDGCTNDTFNHIFPFPSEPIFGPASGLDGHNYLPNSLFELAIGKNIYNVSSIPPKPNLDLTEGLSTRSINVPLSKKTLRPMKEKSYQPKPYLEPPVGTDGRNGQFTTKHYYYNAGTEQRNKTVPTEPRSFLTNLYSISYMYFSPIACTITVVAGIIASYVTGTEDQELYDEKLLMPLALKISRMFPGKPRRYTSDKVFSRLKTYSTMTNGHNLKTESQVSLVSKQPLQEENFITVEDKNDHSQPTGKAF